MKQLDMQLVNKTTLNCIRISHDETQHENINSTTGNGPLIAALLLQGHNLHGT